MLCAHEMIEYFYSVATRIVGKKKKANTRIVFQKTYTKPWLK